MSLAASPLEAAAGPRTTASSCPLPPTDLCTDYSYRGRRWGSLPVRYFVNETAAPAGAGLDVQDAFSTWENELKSPQVEAAYPGDGSGISFSYAGPTMLTAPQRDGINTVIFRPSSGAPGAATIYTRGSEIVEFDITLNSSRQWQTDLTCPSHACGALDVQNVATHEIGHVLDLYHVTSEADALLTMYGGAADGSSFNNETAKRDLGAGDVLGLRRAYPIR